MDSKRPTLSIQVFPTCPFKKTLQFKFATAFDSLHRGIRKKQRAKM